MRGADAGIPDTVSFVEYFHDHDGLTILRGASDYRRRPAALVNPQTAAQPLFRERFNRRLAGHTPAEGVARFEQATVSDQGTIRLADGRLVAETVPPDGRIPRARTKPTRHLDVAVLASQPGGGNYGHFLLEILPRLALSRDALPDGKPILLHARSRPFAAPLLEAAGIGPDRLIWFDGEPLAVAELYWPTRHRLHVLELSPHAVAWLRRLGAEHRGELTTRLFVGRGDAATRRLVNEDEILSGLEPHGFRRVVPGTLSFADQVAAFADAEAVVGVAGAALANLVFMRPGGTVIMLTPATMGPVFFWDLASQADQDLVVVWGPTTERRPSSEGGVVSLPPRHRDFAVDDEAFDRAIATALTRRELREAR